MRPSRRAFLVTTGGVLSGVLAGCTGPGGPGTTASDGGATADDDTPGGSGTDTPTATDTGALAPPAAPLDGSTVDYPAFVDGAAAVSEGGRRIEYGDRERFEVAAGVDGEPASPGQLRLTRELGTDVPAGFVAPVYRERFVYHVFVNDAFRDLAEWHTVVAGTDGEFDGTPATFQPLADGVHHLAVAPALSERSLLVVDAGAERLDAGGVDLTGLVLHRASRVSPSETEPPQALFTFEYDADAGEVTITHEGGDTVAGANTVVVVGEERLTDPFGVESVGAGDTATVAVGGGETVRVVWQDGDRSAVLAEFAVPA
jgi:hypothetical protein